MITTKKIQAYKRHFGNIDSWARGSTKEEREILNDDEWYQIDNYVNSLIIIKRELTSDGFKQTLFGDIQKNSDLEAREFLDLLGFRTIEI